MSQLDVRRAILVSISDDTAGVAECERSLDELERLLDTAGGLCYAKVIQVKEKYDPRTCIGSGKVKEIKELCERGEVDLVVFDFELTPAQIRCLEDDISCGVDVIDRSMLILDIFAQNATTGEGKLQVQLAQLRYSAPRLVGKGASLSRQGGGIGSRGPGETKLETDRRHVKEKIAALEKKLDELEQNRKIMRAQRDRSGLPKVALVGYTNAGKSTILNRLTNAGVLAQNKLFATLDPTTRKLLLPDGESVLLTDTVGFVRKLPHHLVKAFKSTLDEVRFADILVVVADASDPEVEAQLSVTAEVVSELGGADKPVIYAFNKCDLCESPPSISAQRCVAISALEDEGMDRLLAEISAVVRASRIRCRLLIPYTEQHIVSTIYDSYTVRSADYTDDGVLLDVVLDPRGRGQYANYCLEN